jgi:predicted DsbA family dithiol-disulfide isomerase
MCFIVASDNNITADIKKITDLKEIMSYGIMQTPGLVINGKVMLSGKLPSQSTLLHWMKENQLNEK